MPNTEYNPAPPEDLVASGGTTGGQPASSVDQSDTAPVTIIHPELDRLRARVVDMGVEFGPDHEFTRAAQHELQGAIYAHRARHQEMALNELAEQRSNERRADVPGGSS